MRSILCSLILLTLLFSTSLAGAEEKTTPFGLLSKSALLMEYSTGEILVEKDSRKQLSPASITKMMVMLLTMEAIDSGKVKLTDKVIATPEACRMGGSQIWLEPGEEMTVEELMKAIGIVSANDASYALAEYLGGSHEEFVRLMNKRAEELGMNETRYVNSTGLSADSGPGNLTSVYDQTILARELLKHPAVLKWTGVWIDSLRGGDSFLRNTNTLVRFYEGCDGLKTGYTEEAGFCLVATAQRNGVRLIATVMKAPDSKARSNEISKLFNYGFSKYKAVPVLKAGEILGKVKVFKGKKEEMNLVVPNDVNLVLKKEEEGDPEIGLYFPSKVRAPIVKGQKVGEVVISFNGEVKTRADMVAEEDLEETGFFPFLLQITRYLLGALVR